MKLFTKVMAAALLSTALSGASMATDLSTLAVDLKIDAARAALKVVKKTDTGLDCDVVLDKDLVAQLSTYNTSKLTTKTSKRIFDGIKALYAELSAAAGGDDKLISVLSKKELKVVLSLDPSKENADYNKAVNLPAIQSLKDAVIDDPFKSLDESFLALKDRRPAAKEATGSETYKTIQDAIVAYERAKASKDVEAAKAVLAEVSKLKVKTKGVGALVAHETGKFDIDAVRLAKKKAVGKAVHVPTDTEKLALESYASLLELVSDGHFASLGFEDADGIKDKAKVDSLLKLIAESIAQKNSMQDRIVELQREVANLKSGKGSDQGQGGGGSTSGAKYPAAEELSEIQRHYLTMGGNYDASTGIFTNPNGTTEQIAPKAQ